MSEKINSYCTICGNGYNLCISCKDKIKLSPWKVYTDTAEHYKIHQILHGLSCNIYTRDEAKDKLKNVDLSDLETFKSNIQSVIKDILKEDKVVKEIVDGIADVKVEKSTTEEFNIKSDVKEDIVENPMPRKRNYKINKVEETE